MKRVLIFSTGHTDVQLVHDNKRQEFIKGQCGEIHDQLKNRPGKWRVVDSPPTKNETWAKGLPTGEILLCTPKVDAALAYFQKVPPDRLLLLETTRESPEDDPRYAGVVLERRATEKSVGEVRRCPFLGPEPARLEERKSPSDAIIRRHVVDKIENAIRAATNDADRVVVASTGGMPEVKVLVRELARLHAPREAAVEFIEIDDGAQSGEPDRAVLREPFNPVEAVQARKRALDLIEGGHFIGAWGVAKALHDLYEPEWTRVVYWLYCFAASLPMPPDCDIEILKSDEVIAVRVAFRVELALRAHDIPRAVQGTVAFLEAAIWEHLGSRTARHPEKRLFKFHQAPSEELVREPAFEKYAALSKTKRDENDNRPFILRKTEDGIDWYEIDTKHTCAIRLAERYFDLIGLTELARAVTPEIGALRNNVAHSEPTQELMKKARVMMIGAKLWSKVDIVDAVDKCAQGEEPVPTFLSQPLVHNVLDKLGVPNPDRLLDDLLATVRERILNPSSRETT